MVFNSLSVHAASSRSVPLDVDGPDDSEGRGSM